MKESKELKRMFADTNDYKASRKANYKEWRKNNQIKLESTMKHSGRNKQKSLIIKVNN